MLALCHWDAAAVEAHERRWPDRTYLCVWQEPGFVWAGPYRRAGLPGCARCAAVRREAIHADRPAVRPTHVDAGPLSAAQVSQVTHLIHHAARTHEAGDHECLVWRLDLLTAQVSRHRLLPVSNCPGCGLRPDDARPGVMVLSAVPKSSVDVYRPPTGDLEDRWQRAYVDEQLGLVRDLTVHPAGVFYDVAAHAGMPGFQEVELTSGRGITPSKSRLSAVAEALERYGGIRPYGRRTSVRARYHDLIGSAIDPRTLGTYDPEAVRQAGGTLRPFDPQDTLTWVWASSLTGGEARLVPEHSAYYGLSTQESGPTFVYESSNGCAVGRSLTEAALYGLLELIERDAFLLSWYGQVPLRPIDLHGSCPPATRWRVERIESRTGYRVQAFDMTLDLQIPAVWVMATDRSGRPQRPGSLHAAAAHLNPVAALDGAMHELAPGIPYACRAYPDRRPALLPQLNDPFQVRRMQDHAALYWLPETFDRLAFLNTEAAPVTLTELAERAPTAAPDLLQDLEGVLRRFSGAGLEVLMVDQTAPEHLAGGLRCVKMIVPGLLPMTFGHAYRRVHHLPRLHSVPPTYGGSVGGALNRHPHPFP
ncbi:TOMM precursor leader peptide-binding protein [Deinococcus aquiradiocola]|uniref:TOMM precursor leader peptide-binding protein n=1 Tax=Deinococcus aquiradiocola TaxID=393059 RepID=UPI00166A453F|nr:TOMM precursor leader peptide-binding protein [Deinococcus aquiradiocola]